MKNYKSIFVGGGFIESQLLWIIPIICGFCKKKKISNIIFEKKISSKILRNKELNILLKNYTLVYLENKKKRKIIKFFGKIKILLIYFVDILKLVFFFQKKSLKNWYKNQIQHAYWDTALSQMSDNQVKPSLFQKLISAILILDTQHNTNKLLKKYDIRYSFMGHSVYKFRVTLAVFRLKKILNFCQANYSFYAQQVFQDLSWNILKQNQYYKIIKKLNKSNVKKYWKKRLIGKSNYEDANVASNGIGEINFYPKNIVLLHIFKDSPFNVIDSNRIYYDYFEWINETISIIKKSKENWSLRLHPNAKRWGENQLTVLKSIIKKLPKNIIIDNNMVSNNYIFKNSNRIVTYSGTSHLEASVFGIKPIIISDVTLSRINKRFVLKPNNKNQYKNFLLRNSNDKIFKQQKKIVQMSKELIFVRENLLSLKNNLDGKSIYRGDNRKVFKNEYERIEKTLKKNINLLEKIGVGFADGKTHII